MVDKIISIDGINALDKNRLAILLTEKCKDKGAQFKVVDRDSGFPHCTYMDKICTIICHPSPTTGLKHDKQINIDNEGYYSSSKPVVHIYILEMDLHLIEIECIHT